MEPDQGHRRSRGKHLIRARGHAGLGRSRRTGKPTEAERYLPWVSQEEEAEEAHTGFEPVLLVDALVERVRQKQGAIQGVSREAS